jgi:tetratricopeptide (TPR) repeat protein
LQAAGDDPAVLANAALTLGDSGEDSGAMMALVDRALALNPSFARGWYIGAILRMRAGWWDEAIEFAEASLRLSPHGRFGQVYTVIGAALLFTRRFAEALPKLLLAVQDDPSFPMLWRYLAICYAQMGRLDEARAVVSRLRAITSPVVANDHIFHRAEDREFYLSGLRLAAGEAS